MMKLKSILVLSDKETDAVKKTLDFYLDHLTDEIKLGNRIEDKREARHIRHVYAKLVSSKKQYV